MLHYSLRTLGAAVTAIAVGCAALLNANHWVASTAWTLVFLVLSLATIAAVLTRRGFWTGFAIAGWLYLLVGIGPLSGYHNGNLLTTAALHQAAGFVHAEEAQEQASIVKTFNLQSAKYTTLVKQGFVPSTVNFFPTIQPSTEPLESFVDIGQSFWTLLLALLGGWFGTFVMARQHHRRAISSAADD